jgi:hypothetical protein
MVLEHDAGFGKTLVRPQHIVHQARSERHGAGPYGLQRILRPTSSSDPPVTPASRILLS